jgi:hypothetical protein
MAGILDKKTRVMDVIVTREGRRQMADGDLRATFASFTDKHTFYEKDIVSGSTDPTKRIYFEACSLASDQIVFEKDDSGRLIGDIPISDLTIFGDNIFEKDAEGEFLLVTGSVFTDKAMSIVTSSIKNFKSQRMIGSELPNEFNSKTFDMSRNKINFQINSLSPFGSNPNNFSIDIQSAMPLFFDPKLVNSPSFKFLPPEHPDGKLVGDYQSISSNDDIRAEDVITKSELLDETTRRNLIFVANDQTSHAPNETTNTIFNPTEISTAFTEAFNQSVISNQNDLIQLETVNIKNTSDDNNMICQVFEVDSRGTNKRFLKLDIFCAANYYLSDEIVSSPEAASQINNRRKKIFYVGKTIKDDLGVPTFIRIFTLMFD